MQKITIEALSVPTLIGVYAWEREQKTPLEMDIELDADLTKAMMSDAVADTIDYALVAEKVQNSAAATSFELLESLGRHLCSELMASFPIQSVKLKIVKPRILPDAQRVSVSFYFAREELAQLNSSDRD